LTELYVTLISVLLMFLHTGYLPSKYLFSLLATGASLDKLLPILRNRERERDLARQSTARRAAKKGAAKNP
jgi:formate-dependent nitrite reductase membrane component NrfD